MLDAVSVAGPIDDCTHLIEDHHFRSDQVVIRWYQVGAFVDKISPDLGIRSD